MKTDNFDLSVIICTYNRERFLGDSLESVAQQRFSACRFEIVLIDNNSTDSTPEICRAFAKKYPEIAFRYVTELNQGHTHARNRGIREASAPILLFLDDDIRLGDDYLKIIHKHFAEHADTAATGNRVVVHYEQAEPAWMSRFLRPMLGEHQLGSEVRQYTGSSYPVGCSMAYRHEVFEKVGLFNTDIGRRGVALGGNDEKELFARVKEAGLRIRYIPDAVLYHRIDDRRLTHDYVRRQAAGVGHGDRIRLKGTGLRGWMPKLSSELIKSGGTLILSVLYLLRLQPAKSLMLIRFRIWVLLGLAGRMEP